MVFGAYVAFTLWHMLALFYPGMQTRFTAESGKANITALWPKDPALYIAVYVSEHKTTRTTFGPEDLLWSSSNLPKDNRTRLRFSDSIEQTASYRFRENASLFAHVFVAREGTEFTPKPGGVDERRVLYGVTPLVRKFPPPVPSHSGKQRLKRFLLTNVAPIQTAASSEPVWYARTDLSIQLLNEQTLFYLDHVPVDIAFWMRVYHGRYLPLLYLDDMWLGRDHFHAIASANNTIDSVRETLIVRYRALSLGWYRLQRQFALSFEAIAQTFGDSDELEQMKDLFQSTDPLLLLLTIVVSVVHLYLDVLAFSSDIGYWLKQRDMTGVSVRSLALSVVSHIIISLYLWDNDANLLVRATTGVSTVLELWKLQRASGFLTSWWRRLTSMGIPPVDVQSPPSSEDHTSQYDREAMRLLLPLVAPIPLAYAAYTLVYQEHAGWLSWFLSSLANAVYVGGFLLMMPQLYVNYKLKSVAHTPAAALIYRAFNTFIDDLFAFIIKMPTMHRLACFRDDIVFVIYMYQRWLYRKEKEPARTQDVFIPESNRQGQHAVDDRPKETTRTRRQKTKSD